VLSVCPLPATRYLFEGFLPAKAGQREERLRALVNLGMAVVFFEAPHRMAATLDDLERLAPSRRVMLGREMTKVHEQYLCDRPGMLRDRLTAADQLRGEFVCVLEGGSETATPLEVRRTMETLVRELSPAQAARLGAALLGRNKRELYDMAVSLRAYPGLSNSRCSVGLSPGVGQARRGRPFSRRAARGKSGLHRTRRQVTPGGREPTESAAESRPPARPSGRVGKGERVR